MNRVVGERFKKYIQSASREKHSRIVLALDLVTSYEAPNIQPVLELLNSVKDHIAAVKIGYPLVMQFGISIVRKIKNQVDLPIIGDFKLADIGNTNKLISELAFKNGVDAVISHVFVGKDALEPIFKVALENGDKGVILIPTMSHKGANDFLNKHTEEFIEIINELGATGVIAPATRPKEIKKIKEKIGDKLVFTPGVGAQGGTVKEAISSGADFVIVGRAIYNSNNPRESAKRLAEESWKTGG